LNGVVQGVAAWGETINPDIWSQDCVMTSEDFVKNYLQYKNVIPNASAVLLKKDSLMLTDEVLQMRYAGDWATWVIVASNNKVAFCAKPLNYFRNHAQTTRSLQLYAKEVCRFKEYFTVLKQAHSFTNKPFNPFHQHYEWLVREWFWKYTHFSLFKGLFPPFPVLFLVRFYIFILQDFLRPILDIRHRLQVRTRLKKLLKIVGK
jgi:hypothetical protein